MQPSAQDLTKGILARDPDVFRYLYRQYADMIRGHVLRNSGSESDADEMVQVTMLELWNAVREDRYRDMGKLGQYIFQIAANSWREELRRRRNRPQQALEDSLAAVEDLSGEELAWAVVKDKMLEGIHLGMKQVDPTCRELLEGYHLNEKSLLELAEQLEYDYNNLRKRIFDCRKKLKIWVERWMIAQ